MSRLFKYTLLCLVAIYFVATGTACHRGVKDTNDYRRHRHHRTERVRHDDKKKDHDKPKTPETDDWATLDIKLTRHDDARLFKELRRWLGTPYKYGASTCGEGTDCSGMVMMVYRNVYDINLERNSARIYERNCRHVQRDKLRQGDLVFFNNGRSDRISHVGIYLRDNKFVHASSSRGVMVSDLTQKYWVEHYQCGGHVVKPREIDS